jgi:hypothetical protein
MAKALDLEKERKEMRKKVKGIFRFHEVPGGLLAFNYKEYKGDPIEKFSMVDGEIYEVPKGVARHLNKNGWYPEYGHVNVPGNEGVKSSSMGVDNIQQRVIRKVRRYSFQSLEFTDFDDAAVPQDKQILQVQNA